MNAGPSSRGPFLWTSTRLNTVSANRRGMHEVDSSWSTHGVAINSLSPGNGSSMPPQSRLSDPITFYPLLHSWIDWIRENGGVFHPVRRLKPASSGR